MSENSNLPDEPQASEGFGDKRGLIIGVVVGLIILGGIAAVVGHRDVLPVDRLLGLIGRK
jgi:hypothetical protein